MEVRSLHDGEEGKEQDDVKERILGYNPNPLFIPDLAVAIWLVLHPAVDL